jgi:hypothetical protein
VIDKEIRGEVKGIGMKGIVSIVLLVLLLNNTITLALGTTLPTNTTDFTGERTHTLEGSTDELPAGDSIVLQFNFTPPVICVNSTWASVTIIGLSSYGPPGEPILPFKIAKILMPPGKTSGRVRVGVGRRVAMEGAFNVEYGKTPIPISSNETVSDKPDEAIYDSDVPYPRVLFSVVSEQYLRGYAILLLKLFPIQYVPLKGELSYFETMTVEIGLKDTEEPSSLSRGLMRDQLLVSTLVDNPQAANSKIEKEAPRSVSPATNLYGSYDYVIITSNALKNSFQTLANWKTQKGLATKVVLVEDILKDPEYNDNGVFGDGVGSPKFNDTQAHIRNFIKDAYLNWGVEYVLLGGDDGIIPSRGVYVYADPYTDYNIPCDLYYGGLDGSWDKNNDTIFGEAVYNWAGPENATAGEEADFFAEVYVGRATVNTPQEAMNFVSKDIAYELNSQADYLKKALMIGEHLDSWTEGGNGKDLVTDIVPQYTTTRLYSRDGTFSKSSVISELNGGNHIVNHDGHAWWTSVMGLESADVDSLTNTEYFMVYSLGCYSAAFDQATSGSAEAIAEHFLFSSHGAFAYIGNSRYGWYMPGSTSGPGEIYDRSFFSTLMSGTRHLGKTLQFSKEQATILDRWTYFTLNLLGDPETEIVTAIAAPTAHFQTTTDLLAPPHVGGIVALDGIARRGTAMGATFSNFTIQFGSGANPSYWMTSGISLENGGQSEVVYGRLGTWNTSQLENGIYALRLRVFDGTGLSGEDRKVVLVRNGWAEARLVSSDYSMELQGDCKTSVATDSYNNLWVAADYYNWSTGHFEIEVFKSCDGGETWLNVYRKYDNSRNLRYPSIATNPYDNSIFIAYEYEYSSNDHDIYVLRCVGGSWYSNGVDIGTEDDRFPSITSEYDHGSSNWQYISYEMLASYDDRDLMFASSTNKGASWTIKKLHGDWDPIWPFPDYHVHAQTTITYGEGNIYIAYKWGDDYNSACEIRIDRSSDSGNSWTQYSDIDGLTNGCSHPSVAATHGGSTVMVTFEYAWSASDMDICYSYSNNRGTSWTKSNSLFASGANENRPSITVDGMGTNNNNVMGYFHVTCQSGNNIEYKKAYYGSLIWSSAQIANERAASLGTAITTQSRDDGQFYPCITWISADPPNDQIWYSTPGADVYLNSDPSGRALSLDSNYYYSPAKVNLIAGYNHILDVPSPQYSYFDTRFLFGNWSDGGNQSRVIFATSTVQNFTANFITEHLLTITTNPIGLGSYPTIEPPGPWYMSGTNVACFAPEVSDFVFQFWNLDGISQGLGKNNITVLMNQPHVVVANYLCEHDLAISLEASQFVEVNSSQQLNVTAFNLGLVDETNVELRLLIDGETVKSVTVEQLAVGSWYSFDYYWTPSVDAEFNFTAQVLTVPGESDVSNNVDSRIVLAYAILPHIIIVNDNDGNYSINGTSLQTFGSALESVGYDYVVWNESKMGNPPLGILTKFEFVIWTCGDYWSTAVDSTDVPTLMSYLAAGGNVILEGEDIGYNHNNDGFMINVAHALYQVDKTGAPGLTVYSSDHPVVAGLPNSFPWLVTPRYDDGTSPVNGGIEVLRYTNTTWAAVTVFDGRNIQSGSSVYFAFPLYCLGQTEAEKLVLNSLRWLDGLTVALNPQYSVVVAGQQVEFQVNASRGVMPCQCEWYIHDVVVIDAQDQATWTFRFDSPGTLYKVKVKLTDALGVQVWAEATVEVRVQLAILPPQNVFLTNETASGNIFPVNIIVANVSDLTSWQVAISYDPSILGYSDIGLPSEHVFSGENMTVTGPDYSIPGYVIFGVTLLEAGNSYTGSGTLCRLNLTILPTNSSLPVTSNIAFANLGTDTFLLGSSGYDIDVSVLSGSFTLLPTPDIAVTEIVPWKTIIGKGYTGNFSVSAKNQDYWSDYDSNITLNANLTQISTIEDINLESQELVTVFFNWNSTDFAYGNYTMSAYAWPVQGETNTANNNFTGGTVEVTIPGDINGDGTANILDAILLSNAYLATPGSSNWNANADINGDNVVNILDAIILSNHYNQHYP